MTADPVADHDCLLRAADMFERASESVRILAQGDDAHRALWESLHADSLRLRNMAAKLGSKITQQQWFENAMSGPKR